MLLNLKLLLTVSSIDKTTLIHPFLYQQLYDINGTPKVYLLDNNKNILVNAIKGNIGVEQLSEVILKEAKNDLKNYLKNTSVAPPEYFI